MTGTALFLGFSTIAALSFGAVRAHGQLSNEYCPPSPAVINDFGVLTGSCDRSPFPSVCWERESDGTRFAPASPEVLNWKGFPLHVDRLWGVGPGDYGPRSLDLTLSSSPLLAGGVPHYRSPFAYAERPLLDDDVDLITGVPLLQESDLELPFGGAVFRHIRTYSESPQGSHEISNYKPAPENQFWDWQGQGWMMGENPLFLFDAGYGATVVPQDLSVRARSYFIPDAHHAIPFDRTEPTPGSPPVYIAPTMFDAIMSYSPDGTWDATNHKWTSPPTTAYVWLQGRSIKYTIHLVHPSTNSNLPADVATRIGSTESLHEPWAGANAPA